MARHLVFKAHATGNRGNVVSVEIDSNVWDILRKNRDLNHCSFHIIQGGVSDTTLKRSSEAEYATTSSKADSTSDPKILFQSLTFNSSS